MDDKVKVWFDPEADLLEVQFRDAPATCARTRTMPSWNAWTSREGFWVSAFLGSVGFERNRWRPSWQLTYERKYYPDLLRRSGRVHRYAILVSE